MSPDLFKIIQLLVNTLDMNLYSNIFNPENLTQELT